MLLTFSQAAVSLRGNKVGVNSNETINFNRVLKVRRERFIFELNLNKILLAFAPREFSIVTG